MVRDGQGGPSGGPAGTAGLQDVWRDRRAEDSLEDSPTWYQGNRKSAHAPPPGQGWDRSSETYLAEVDGRGRLKRPIILHRWRRPTANS